MFFARNKFFFTNNRLWTFEPRNQLKKHPSGMATMAPVAAASHEQDEVLLGFKDMSVCTAVRLRLGLTRGAI